jgi:biopolymer transport protein ExbD
MSWQVRHEGSPQAVEGLSLDEVLHGLEEGRWEPTDEVRGPTDAGWQPLETHPATAEAAGEIEPPPPRHYDDGTHLDFNALIDVCLVLLIFFILTTTYAALQARLNTPDATSDKADGPAAVTPQEIEQQMIRVSVKMEDGKPVTRVEDKVVAADDLEKELRRFARASKKSVLLLEHEAEVPHGAVVAVQDAAKGAGMERVLLLVPESELPRSK